MQTAAVLELRHIHKSFAGIQALQDISLHVRAGEVLCLLGDNGAGKSTLIKVMSGYHPPTSGTILVDGVEHAFKGPREARKLGIATVHQDVGSVPLMSVGRNFFLGAEPTKGFGPFRWIDDAKANAVALEQMRLFGITRVRDGDQLVGTMSGGERQVLAIGRAMYFGAKVLILDEPTSALGVKEAAIVLRFIKKARADGIAIVFITHNVRHAIAVGDRFVALIHGKMAASFAREEKSHLEILNLMAGGEEMTGLDSDLEAVGSG